MAGETPKEGGRPSRRDEITWRSGMTLEGWEFIWEER